MSSEWFNFKIGFPLRRLSNIVHSRVLVYTILIPFPQVSAVFRLLEFKPPKFFMLPEILWYNNVILKKRCKRFCRSSFVFLHRPCLQTSQIHVFQADGAHKTISPSVYSWWLIEICILLVELICKQCKGTRIFTSCFFPSLVFITKGWFLVNQCPTLAFQVSFL